MTIRRSLSETAVWLAIALAGGLGIGQIDVAPREGQGTVLLLMVFNFALTLPGRAPIVLTAVVSAAGIWGTYLLRLHAWNPGTMVAVVPALIAGGGGSLVGRLLDVASVQLVAPPQSGELPWHRRPLSLRFVLGTGLVSLSAAGAWSIHSALA